MEPELIKKILRKKIKDLTGLGSHTGAGFDKTMIHDFRVAYKTLRSFLRLLSVFSNNTWLKIPKKIKRLYHISGSIRDMQLELEKITDKQLPFPVYVNYLRQNINRKKMEWQKHYSKKIFHDLRLVLTDRELWLPSVHFIYFVDLKMAAISNICALKSPTDDQVHSIRKLVKDIIYTATLARKTLGDGYRHITELQTGPLEEISDAIGEYNDARSMLDHLCSYRSKAMENEEKSAMEDFCNEEKKRLKKMKKETIAMVKKYTELTP